jgi:CRISPR-associated endonuclease Csn1
MTETLDTKQEKKGKKGGLTIGLDIGTASVGWAVIDNQFNLVQGKKRIIDIDAHGVRKTRKSRTNLWGARTFDEGQTAEVRRLQRGTRRRLARRTERLKLLRGIFAEEINKVDESFFIRLAESFYQNEDTTNKNIITDYPLFHGTRGSGETFANDKAYHKKYPTIYHLRKDLIYNPAQKDLRLVYLALHHILKYRGHFVNAGQTFDLAHGSIDMKKSFTDLYRAFSVYVNEPLTDVDEKLTDTLDRTQEEAVQTILADRKKSKSWKAYELAEVLITSDNKLQKQQKALYTAIVGNGIDLAKIFANENYSHKVDEAIFPKAADFKYSNDKYDEHIANIGAVLNEEEMAIIEYGKQVYESIILSQILTQPTLAASMVEKYELHKQQLEALKMLTKSIDYALYEQVFKADGVYTKYVDGVGNPGKKLTQEDFYKALKKLLEGAIPQLVFPKKEAASLNFDGVILNEQQKATLIAIDEAMQVERYLPKQRTSANGAIPYQIHEHELVKIIENQKAYYPFLGDALQITREDDAAGTVKKKEYKIQILMKFRIPYYVGPLAQSVGWARDDDGELIETKGHSSNSWVVRNSTEKLTPWNFDEVINKEASAENFIARMTGFCTYLPTEKVLAKNSLLYQEYTIYNELMSCGYYSKGKKVYFSAELKKDIVAQLFQQQKKVLAKDMVKFLVNEHRIDVIEPDLFGIDQRVKTPGYNTTFSTYRDLIGCGISATQIADNRERFEQIITWQTVLEDKAMLKKRIKQTNADVWHNFLTPEQINKLANKHYTGWGRLSKKLLDGIKTSDAEGLTIINHLKKRPYSNFMRLLEDPKIAETIAKAQGDLGKQQTFNYELVEKLAGSPKIKKSIWQTLQIITELEHYLGVENIDRIVIEMARDNSGGRTKTRQQQIEKFQKEFLTNTGKKLDEQIKTAFVNETKAAFNDEKRYLYFLQNGKCMYSGQELSLENLSTYEVDHIIPQTYIKDDSIDNKVLVLKSENQNKGGDVPSQIIVNRMRPYWELLAKNHQVSAKKLANLTRGTLSDETKAGFINRQLVETRQITKHLANILNEYFKDKQVDILTPRAQLVSQFRDGIVYLPAGELDDLSANEGDLEILPAESDKFVKVRLHDKWHKNRELNDYHHAHDAYLVAIVGTYLYAVRPDLRGIWVYNTYKKDEYAMMGRYVGARKEAYRQLLSGMVAPQWSNIDLNTGEVSPCYPDVDNWSRDDVLQKITQTLQLRNINIVKKTEIQDGKFGKEEVWQKTKNEKEAAKIISLKKKNNPNLYGGRKSEESAFAVIVKNKKGEIASISVSAMQVQKYLKSTNKLSYLQQEVDKTITAIVRSQMTKYTKYMLPDDSGTMRLMASFQEASSGRQLPMMNVPTNIKDDTLTEAQEQQLMQTYKTLVQFIAKNKLFKPAKIELLADDGLITDNFKQSTAEDKQKILVELFKVAKGSARNLEALAVAGLGTKDIRMTTKRDLIQADTVVIDQSVTGLYETRRKL